MRHFRVEVNPQRRSAAQGRFKKESPSSRHRVDHGPSVHRPSSQIDRQPSQHRVKADGFEERPLTSTTLTVGKGRLPVAFHPPAREVLGVSITDERQHAVRLLEVDGVPSLMEGSADTTGKTGEAPTVEFSILRPPSHRHAAFNRVSIDVGER